MTVTAQDGTSKTYTVTVTRENAEEGAPEELSETPKNPIMPKDPTVPKDTTVSAGSLVVRTTLDSDGHTVAELAAADLLSVLKLPVKGNVTIDIQASAAPSSITVQLPSQALQNGLAGGGVDFITIRTALANIILSAEMLARALEGSEDELLSLTVAAVNASELPDSVRSRIGQAVVYDFNLSLGHASITDFPGSKDVTVELDYILQTRENPERIVVYYLDDQGRLQAVKNSKYDKNAQKLSFSPKHFSKYAGMEANVSFHDLETARWAEPYILNLAAREIVDGVAEGQYQPESMVTRAQFVKLLVEAMELNTDAVQDKAIFTDMVEGAWYGKSIGAARESGIVQGREDGSFGVNDPVSREDIAVMSYRTLQHLKANLKGAEDGGTLRFADQVAIAGYAREAVEQLTKAGVINGLSEGRFAPQEQATRAQAAAIVYRMLQGIWQ
ncbi:MAG: hypothetical protein K0R57_1176 [Paenibacillaceae bacterium]|nr:hypothetical protein [Paenibacillaceae bacterium]